MNMNHAFWSKASKCGVVTLMLFGASSLLTPAFAGPLIKPNYNQPVDQTKKITGTVTDANGEPLVGVTVKVNGKSDAGTITDIDGNFSLSVSSSRPTLVFSYIGYETKEVVAQGNILTVRMEEENNILNDVIVIGYGTTTRKSVVGAVDRVGAQMLEDRPVANLTQALQGAAPNLIIQRKSYNPNGEANNLNVRGISTTNDNSPLVVIDGLICDGGALDKLNPNDIDNISVLKDAGASAIYGSRSSNGVILVTTKQGTYNQKPVVRLTSSVGWQDPKILFHPVAGYQNATLKNLALANSGMTPTFTQEQIMDLYNHRSEEVWGMDEIFRTALQQSHNVSVTGGGNNTSFMFSAGYYDQESNYAGNDDLGIQRYNLRANITTEVGRFKFQTQMAFTRNNSMSTTGGSLEINASRTPSYYYYRLQNPETGHYLVNDVVGDFTSLGMIALGGVNKFRNNDFVGSVNVEMKVIDGLKLRGIFGANVQGQHRYTRTHRVPFYALDPETHTVESFKGYNTDNNYTDDWNYDAYNLNSQLLLDYNKTFGKHNVTGLVGITNESFTSTSNEIRIDYANEDLGTGASDDAEITIGGGSGVTPERTTRTSISSLLGRVGYNYAEKYYAEFDFRYDGSSKFAKGHRWGFFPSLSLGWRISEEAFMTNYRENVGDLKIRGSYGVLGNQTIGTYARYTTYDMYANAYAYYNKDNKTVTGAGFTLGTPELKWEKTKTFNIGADATFLNGHLNIGLDYFYKRTVDILLRPVVPAVFGTIQSMGNIGEMSNRGWELSANYRLTTGKVNHTFGLNIGDSFNRLEKFPEGEEITTVDEISNLKRVGVPLGSYYGYKTDGLFQSYEEIETSAVPVGVTVQPGDVKFVDRNDDGVIDSKDRFILGNGFPRYTYGFTYNLTWKGLDFGFFLQGVGKRDMMIRGELVEPFHANYSYCIYKHQLDFWTPTNTDARFPRLTAAGSQSSQNNYRQGSDLYLFNGAYMRVKNITLGYTLPKSLTSRLGINKVRFYVNAQDPFTFSSVSFVDPETSEFGSSMSGGANSARNYPSLSYYGFGLDLEF